MATTAVISGTTPTSTGTASYTSTGFGTPQAALIFISGANTTNNPQAHAFLGFGSTDGTNDIGFGNVQEDAVTTTNTFKASSSTACIYLPNVSGTAEVVGVFSAWTTDGITINFTTVGSVAYHIQVVLIKGCNNAEVRTQAMSSVAADTVISDLGFKPNLVFCMTSWVNSDGITAAVRPSFGAAHNSSTDTVTQCCIGWNHPDAIVLGSDPCNNIAYNNRVGVQSNYNADTRYITVGSFTSSGFTITTDSIPGGSMNLGFLSLDTGDTDGVSVDIVDSPTTGTWNCETPGFQPQTVILGLVTGSTVNAYNSTDPYAVGFGLFDDTNEACLGFDHDDAASTTDTQSNYSTSNAISLYHYSGGHVKLIEGAFSSFDSLGYNMTMSTTYGTALKWLSIAIRGATSVNQLLVAQNNTGGF